MAPIHYASRTYSSHVKQDPTAAAVITLVEHVVVNDVACTRKVVLDGCLLIAREPLMIYLNQCEYRADRSVGVLIGMLMMSVVRDAIDKYRSADDKAAVILLGSEVLDYKE